jgi:hypothetical protein
MKKLKVIFRTIYLLVLVILLVTTAMMLWDGSYLWGSLVIAAAAILSILTSLIPYFISMKLLKIFEDNPTEKKHLKTWAFVIYTFCFPVKLCIIYINVYMLINGGPRWAFG